jgi:hypothetical protein
VRQERFDAVDRSPQVHVDDPAPVVVAHLADRAADRDACVVEDDVDASEGSDDVIGERVHRGVVRYVAHARFDPTGSHRIDCSGGRAEGGSLHVDEHQMRTATRKLLCGRKADAARAARHHRNFVRVIHVLPQLNSPLRARSERRSFAAMK